MLAKVTKVLFTFSEMLYDVKDSFEIIDALEADHAERIMNIKKVVRDFDTKYNINFLSASRDSKTRA